MGGRGGGGKRTRRERPDVLPTGAAVTVRGLQGAAQHNGKAGSVKDFDDESSRYTVQLSDGDVLKIKHANLLQTLQVEVVNMKKTELNGMDARIEAYDEDKQRYHVQLNGGTTKVALQPANLILPKGARAHIVNLTKGTQWNQKVGKVLDYDRQEGRYLVQMSEEQQLRVKLENLLL